MRQKLLTFIVVFIVWVIFTGRISPDVIIVGLIASTLTTFMFNDMIFRSYKNLNFLQYIKKFLLIILFIPVFFYEALIAAVRVSKHVFEKEPSFNPGIVKIKTSLTNVTALTILANLITLTPGTLTLDFNVAERVYFIHWIDVKSVEEAEQRKEIIEKFEKWLGEIFK